MEVKNFSNGLIDLPVKVDADNNIMFDAEKAAIGLGLSQIAKSGNVVARWERVNKYLSSPQVGTQIQKGDYITEQQFYKLAIKANNEAAERFQDWVTSEVLPDIRKHGMYMTGERLASTLAEPENLIKILTAYQQEKIEKEQANQKVIQLSTTIKKVKPKIQYHDRVLRSNARYTTTQIAKMYGLSGQKLNRILNEEKFIYFQNGEWLLYAKFQDKGLLESETKISQYGYTYQSSKWTERGRKAIFTLLKLRRNMYPKKVAAKV